MAPGSIGWHSKIIVIPHQGISEGFLWITVMRQGVYISVFLTTLTQWRLCQSDLRDGPLPNGMAERSSWALAVMVSKPGIIITWSNSIVIGTNAATSDLFSCLLHTKKHLYASVRWKHSSGETPRSNWLAVMGCVLFCLAGANPCFFVFLFNCLFVCVWRMVHGRMVNMLTTRSVGENVSLKSKCL